MVRANKSVGNFDHSVILILFTVKFCKALCSQISIIHGIRRLEGKVALITGGARGIGESIARLFHLHGAKICIADINVELGNKTAASVGTETLFIHCDVTQEQDVSQAIDTVVSKFGTIDILINNAGVSGKPINDIRNVDLIEFQQVIDVNLIGVFNGMKHAARIMIPNKKGSIVSIASVSSVIGGTGAHAYTASKYAVVGITQNAAAELGQYGIRVNCVSPYAIPTDLALPYSFRGTAREVASKDFQDFVDSNANLKGISLKPEDVAEAVLYLASDESKYVSGMNLLVDGGFSCCNHSLHLFR